MKFCAVLRDAHWIPGARILLVLSWAPYSLSCPTWRSFRVFLFPGHSFLRSAGVDSICDGLSQVDVDEEMKNTQMAEAARQQAAERERLAMKELEECEYSCARASPTRGLSQHILLKLDSII